MLADYLLDLRRLEAQCLELGYENWRERLDKGEDLSSCQLECSEANTRDSQQVTKVVCAKEQESEESGRVKDRK